MPQAALNLAGFNEDTAENILENRRRFLKLFPARGVWPAVGRCMAPMCALVNSSAEAKPAENAQGDTIYCDAIVSDADQFSPG